MKAMNPFSIAWKEEYMKESNKFAKQTKFNWDKQKKFKP